MARKDAYAGAKRSWVMSRIKSSNTAPELALRGALWAAGSRYRKNVKPLPGKPDIVFSRAKVAVFVDGSFWHGKKLTEERLKEMPAYWQAKIAKNMARDEKNTRLLTEMGFLVLRFTDVELKADLARIAEVVVATVASRGRRASTV